MYVFNLTWLISFYPIIPMKFHRTHFYPPPNRVEKIEFITTFANNQIDGNNVINYRNNWNINSTIVIIIYNYV